MLSETIENALNKQIKLEANACMRYLAMATWAEVIGYNGVAGFFYKQSDEERIHMLKLVKFVNERGGTAEIPSLEAPKSTYKDLHELFGNFLESEEAVTESINHLVFQTLEEKNYTVHNFLQWYVAEQAEEEALARTILDKLKIIGDDKSGTYLFDKDIEGIVAQTELNEAQE
ncbi:ferritin [Ochrovirga pacifica]|uniref:ferritin n=1 Tax=Ochrovirga pacifica TaxID=1042376 RepID=UPI0002558E52|nr:ferritin [Ochrovirga pacifica]